MEWEALGPPDQWRWLASMGKPDLAPIHHPRHQRWIKTHSHQPSYRDVMLTLKGSNIFGMNGRVYERKPGSVMLFERGESRDYQIAPYQRKKPYGCLWLHLHDEQSLFYQIRGVDAQGERWLPLPMRIKADRSALLITAAWDQCRNAPADPLAWMYLKNIVSSVLLEILATATPNPPHRPHREMVQTLQRYIRANLAGDLSLRHLAGTAGYSPFFFHRVFRSTTGQTVLEYINALRVERAKELLKLHYTVEAITEEVGFASPSYFRRLFHKTTGLSPREWMRAVQG